MAQAMVLKRAGDPLGAAVAMEEARSLDGQDRFLNGKAAKYWLRAGEVKKAEDLVSLFTKVSHLDHGSEENFELMPSQKDISAVADLTDLQCLWFLQEEGDAHNRNGNLALALKRYQALATVRTLFLISIALTELDIPRVRRRPIRLPHLFPTPNDLYRLRRVSTIVRLYPVHELMSSLMQYEDQLRSHPAYFKAATEAIDIYCRIHDDPSLTEETLSTSSRFRNGAETDL